MHVSSAKGPRTWGSQLTRQVHRYLTSSNEIGVEEKMPSGCDMFTGGKVRNKTETLLDFETN